jgi:hypothetical protein
MAKPLILLAVVLLTAATLSAAPPAVVELFEDDTEGLIPQLTMGGIGGGEAVGIGADKDDVFTGKVSLRVAAMQRFSPDIKAWNYTITEKPKEGEYRYLRFAWKKTGEGPIMIQFHTRTPNADWNIRYYMGANGAPWPAKELSRIAPTEWQVVTCDLFKDSGALSIGGVAFTPYQGADGLFDHILLGRTIDDLDKVTAKALFGTKGKALTAGQFRGAWEDLASVDPVIAETAKWRFVATHHEGTAFLRKTVTLPNRAAPAPVDETKAKPLIEGLTHYRHLARESAAEELMQLGDGTIPHLRKAIDAADGENKKRLQLVMDRWTVRAGYDEGRLRRCASALRLIGTPEAKELLARIEKVLP